MQAVGSINPRRAASALFPILCMLACGEATQDPAPSSAGVPVGPGTPVANTGDMVPLSTQGGTAANGGGTSGSEPSGGMGGRTLVPPGAGDTMAGAGGSGPATVPPGPVTPGPVPPGAGGSMAGAGGSGPGSVPTGAGGSMAGAGGSSGADLGSPGGAAGMGGAAGNGGTPGLGGAANLAGSGGTPAQTDWVAGADAKELIKSGNPGNAKLVAYADNQLGSPVIGLEGTGIDREHTACVVVPPGVIYDGKGETLTAKGLGNGSQDEGQIPYFLLMPGAGIKNVTIGKPGTEGIHMMGNNTVENVVWEDVGEDAGSVRSYFPGGYIYIEGGSVNSASDKTFQLNAPSTIIIKNFKATNISKLVRQGDLLQGEPGGEVPIEVILDNVTATNVKTALVMCNDMDCTLMTRDVSGSPLTSGGVEKIDWVEGASDRPTQ